MSSVCQGQDETLTKVTNLGKKCLRTCQTIRFGLPTGGLHEALQNEACHE